MNKRNKPSIGLFNLLRIVAVASLLSISGSHLVAQPGPPPQNPDPGNQTGGNAPIGSGMIILLALGAAYGGKKVYHAWKNNMEE